MQNKKLILLGLNELNLEYVENYISKGHLPNFKHLFENYGYKQTTSEAEYHLLEPWIQWVTLHTGKTYEEHRVFRLGDIVDRKDIYQLWEIAEEKGLTVGAVSPFNTDNRLKNAKFFVPDPWTKTRAAGDAFVKQVSAAVSQAVNDNAKGGLNKASIMALLKTYLKVVPVSKYNEYLSLVAGIKSKVGTKAVILDKLLGDLFMSQWKKHKPDFSSLFLNTGAHFQHHYMFNSIAYNGEFENPEWYCPNNQDPLFEILNEYDKLLGRLLKTGARLLVATGLHQKPHKHLTYYWRLKEHDEFLRLAGISNYQEVIPRMSRDFLVNFDDTVKAKEVEEKLSLFKAIHDGENIFTIDNRGKSLFVELTYPKNIPDNFDIQGDRIIENFGKYVAFVAIKNGEHDGVGYFIDTQENELPETFELARVFDHIISSF
ncbi:alkaline phosphatase family protein [Roseivirga pacifica]|uniref:alkaline phosphatase family protein n=1 Tax=Roseivirga pacifica TaxID=1267423 RepID=UPI00227C79CA|nr:alkaline phosphatase family protein [Roseivirga pacifica]